ncbi:MAG TPA: CBS domain-containing protein [Gemmatimonadales bacterium]|nr:CBS domain-containing protein [Gemmatimonadales bacterium]
MGEHDVLPSLDDEQRRRFSRAVLDDLRALDRMCTAGLIEQGMRRIGAEQEMFLVDRSGRPAPIALDLLPELGEGFTTEIGRFNLECNLPPSLLGPGALRAMEADLDTQLARVRAAAQQRGADVLLAGILPSIDLADLVVENLTPLPRYHELNHLITTLTGGPVRTLIQGRDNLQVSLDNVMLEACNTSFQVHLQVSAEEFARFYNVAQLVAGPVVAASANSPILLQHRLWHETRIPAFEQSIDIRSAPSRQRGTYQRVSFGEGWVNDSLLELLQDQVARHRVMMMGETGESSLDVLARGEVPRLRALCLHNGSVYRWNRPCYGILDGKPHLRIEHRPLPAGPTVVDEVANAALLLGLMLGIERTYGDVRARFNFGDARGNFVAAARYGLYAGFRWEGDEAIDARTLLSQRLIPLAREGLREAGVTTEECDRYLGLMDARVRTGRNGAAWMLEAYQALGGIRSPTVRSQVLTRAIMARQWIGVPVHEWTLPSMSDEGRWQERFQRVSQVMSTDIFTIGPDDLVDVAAAVMHWKRIRHVPVEDAGGRLVGLVSYRALVRLVGEGRGGQPVPVREIMQPDPVTVSPAESCRNAVRLMHDRKLSCLPVVHEGRLVGIVSERDFLQVALELFDGMLAQDERDPPP